MLPSMITELGSNCERAMLKSAALFVSVCLVIYDDSGRVKESYFSARESVLKVYSNSKERKRVQTVSGSRD